MTGAAKPDEPTAGRKVFTPFRWGLLVGVVLPLASFAAIGGAGRLWAPRPTYNVQLVSSGADLTRQNGAKLIFSSAKAAVTQTCNGVCDDLRIEENSGGDAAYQVRVLDPQGTCVACSEPRYVTNGYGAPVSTWTIAGASKLQVSVKVAQETSSAP